MATMRDLGSAFYSKWAVMQWTHPSSLRAIKCKVWQYAVASISHAAGVIRIVFILWDPKVNMNIRCDMLCWLH
jgi:hypothetical protein